jgi:GDP-L-fucose synthase
MKATVFGSQGLLGSEVVHTRSKQGVEVYCPTSYGLNLSENVAISSHNDVWINCAAKVGGLAANMEQMADFYLINSKINNNVMEGAKNLQVKKLVSILSTCIYPDQKYITYPLTEDQLHLGPPHQSNFGYAFSKRMVDVATRAYRQQHKCDFVTVIPNNLYGPRDNYDINKGHVIPSLIRKFFEAKQNGHDVTVWGTGKPLREFTFAEDAAKIIWWIADNYSESEPVNIGNTNEVSIADLSELIGKIIGFTGQIKFDSSKPDGQYRKPTSNAKLLSKGCNPQYTSLEKGLEITIDHFVKNYPNVRGA